AGHGATPERPRLLDGLRVLNADSLLWSLMVGAMFVVLTAEAINVLEIFLARRTLGATETQYGLLSAVMGVGVIAGSLAAGQIRTEKVRLIAFLGSVGGASLMVLAMGLVPSLGVLYVVVAIGGIAIGALNATFGALIMMRTPEAKRGQVSAISVGLTRAVSIGALGLGGLLGSLFDPRTGFLICGAFSLLVSMILAAVVAAQHPVLDVPGVGAPAADRPAADSPAVDRPAADGSAVDGSAAGNPAGASSAAETRSSAGDQEALQHQIADVVAQLDTERGIAALK
ncbi:MAG: MFS transporter, partial [Actinomycetales bacterium]